MIWEQIREWKQGGVVLFIHSHWFGGQIW